MPNKFLYNDFHKIDLGYLKGLVERDEVSKELANVALNSWQKRLSNFRDPLFQNYIDYFIFFEAINNGILAVSLANLSTREILNEYSVLPDLQSQITKRLFKQKRENFEQESFKYCNNTLTAWYLLIEGEGTSYAGIVVYPKSLTNIGNCLLRLEFVLKRYYFPQYFEPDNRVMTLFLQINQEVTKRLNDFLKEGKPVAVTYFKFKNFNDYIEFAGEDFALQIVDGLIDEIKDHMKNEDRCFVLSPREYLIFSVNCTEEIMKQRFHRVSFKIKGLILTYKNKYSTLKKPIKDLFEIWDDIAIT